MPPYRCAFPPSPFPGRSTQTAYTPSGGNNLRGSGGARFAVGTPIVLPRPAPRSTVPVTLYGRPNQRRARSSSPCATAARISVEEIGWPSSRTASITPPAPAPAARSPPAPPGGRDARRRRCRPSLPLRARSFRHHDARLEQVADALGDGDEVAVREQGDPSLFLFLRGHRASVEGCRATRVVQLPPRQVGDQRGFVPQVRRRHDLGRDRILQAERPDASPPH